MVNPKAGTAGNRDREGVDIVLPWMFQNPYLQRISHQPFAKIQQLVTQIINNLASDRMGLIMGKPLRSSITHYYGLWSAKCSFKRNTDLISSQEPTQSQEAIQLKVGPLEDSQASKGAGHHKAMAGIMKVRRLHGENAPANGGVRIRYHGRWDEKAVPFLKAQRVTSL
jgi:hypothetical protein